MKPRITNEIHPEEPKWSTEGTSMSYSIAHSRQKAEASEMSANRWMRKQNVVHMDYVSALIGWKFRHVTAWMNPEDIMQSKISQSQKDKYSVSPFILNT